MGDSAGGNLVMMLGLLCTDPERLAAIAPSPGGGALPRARSIVSLYGVLDRLSWLEQGFPGARLMLHCYGGPGAFETEVGPELALTPMDVPIARRPPCLLAIGTADPLAESSRLACARLREDGARVELVEYPGERHGFFNTAWRPAARKLRSDVIRFLDSV
jgi:acetyl esterase/lipase